MWIYIYTHTHTHTHTLTSSANEINSFCGVSLGLHHSPCPIHIARIISPLDLLLDIRNALKNGYINLVLLLPSLYQPLVGTSHGLY